MPLLDDLGNAGSFAQGVAALVAVVGGLRALRDWERKRVRDRRAEVATRVIRLVAATCEDMSSAVLTPALRVGYAEIAAVGGGRHQAPIARDRVLRGFDQLMDQAQAQVREVFKVHVEARVHLTGEGEVEVVGSFLSACRAAEEQARCATLAIDDALNSEAGAQLKDRLNSANRLVIDAREEVVRVLGPVARDGRPGPGISARR